MKIHEAHSNHAGTVVLVLAVTLGVILLAGCVRTTSLTVSPRVYAPPPQTGTSKSEAHTTAPISVLALDENSERSEPLWLYVEASDGVDPKTLKMVAEITTTFTYFKSDALTLSQFLRKYYGIESKSIQQMVLAQNPRLRLNQVVQGPIVLIGAPVFSPKVFQNVPQTSDEQPTRYPSFGSAYLRVQPDRTADIAALEAQLNGLRFDDPQFDFRIVRSFHAVPSWTTCPSPPNPSEEPANFTPFASLDDWMPNRHLRKVPIRIAVIDTGVALDSDRAEPDDAQSIRRDDLDTRLPIWKNDSPTTRVLQNREEHEVQCLWDLFGCNFATVPPDGTIEDVSSDLPEYGHGTHVAGIASGVSGGVERYTDLVEIMPLKVQDKNGYIDPYSFEASLAYAIANQARIVNISLNGTTFPGFDEKVSAAANAKMVIIVAAGNGPPGKDGSEILPERNSLQYPAWLSYKDNVITVGAVDSFGHFANFSNRSRKYVTIAAPGYVASLLPNGKKGELCGTSQATPTVSFTVALMLAMRPDLRPHQVKEILQLSSDFDPSLIDKVAFAARLNMKKALSLEEDLIEMRSDHGTWAAAPLRNGDIVSPPKQIHVIYTPNGGHSSPLTTPNVAKPSISIAWTDVARIDFDLGGTDRVLSWDTDDNSNRNLAEHWGHVDLDSAALKDFGTIKREKIATLILRYPR